MPQISLDSTVRDLYETPVGHDVIEKVLLQMNLSEKWILNPIIGKRKIRTLSKLTGKQMGPEFWQTLIALVNSEPDVPADRTSENSCAVKPAWWKEAVIYQIYPRSFCDSNGDGVGDIHTHHIGYTHGIVL